MFTIDQILQAVNGRLLNRDCLGREINGICIDSRKITAGQLFIAIKGDNFDGHDFILSASEKKAAAVLCSESWADINKEPLQGIKIPVIVVDDTVFALGRIAKEHRKRFSIPVIAVTGSNGKTTTKNMIAALLQSDYNVLKSKASFNNHIGVPLTLLELKPEHTAAVIEMGMNHKGEIRGLASIAAPSIAVITNAATAHIEYLGSEENIVEAKCELLENLAEDDPAFINADSALLYKRVKNFPVRIIDFGVKAPCAYQASNIISDEQGIVFTLNQKYTFRLGLIGEHNVYNALCAIAVARHLKVDYDKIRTSLLGFTAVDMRMQSIRCADLNMIVDCYNANPDSAQAAIKALSEMKTKNRKIFVFGDMLELGSISDPAHQQIGRIVSESKIDRFVTVGRLAGKAAKSARDCGFPEQDVFECTDTQQAAEVLGRTAKVDDIVLLKASRAMKLEKIIDFLNNNSNSQTNIL